MPGIAATFDLQPLLDLLELFHSEQIEQRLPTVDLGLRLDRRFDRSLTLLAIRLLIRYSVEQGSADGPNLAIGLPLAF